MVTKEPVMGLRGLASYSWRTENGAAALREGHAFSFGSNEKWVASCSPDCRVVTAPQMKLRGAEDEYDEPNQKSNMGTEPDSSGQAASSR